MIIFALAILGLCLGSFVNALVWRLSQQEQRPSILNGRSQCPSCGHQLATKDLIPVLSWLTLRGRCRYCRRPISRQYPLVELALAAVFVASYVFWPGDLNNAGQVVLLITWLAAAVGLLALLVYDFRWMLLPSKIIYPTLLIATAGRLIYLVGYEPHKPHALAMWLVSLAMASGLFLGLFLISSGKWIGYGDVRLGLITGTLLARPSLSLLMILLASLLGTLFILPAVALGKKGLSGKMPFGPFLIAATTITLLFGQSMTDWYGHFSGLN